MEDRLRGLATELPDVLAAWEAALAQRDAAVRRRDVARTRAEACLRASLGGLTLGRWRALVAGTASIRTRVDGRELALARRRAPRVEEALGAHEVLDAASEGGLEAADDALAAAAARLLAYGAAASDLTGRPTAELRRLAERPERRTPR